MRKFEDLPNLETNAFYAYDRKVRDKTVSLAGTQFGDLLFGDIIETVQKIALDSGITRNGLPDNNNSGNGYQIIEAMTIVFGNVYSGHVKADGSIQSSNRVINIDIERVSTGRYELGGITNANWRDYRYQLTPIATVDSNIGVSAVIFTPPVSTENIQVVITDVAGSPIDSDFCIDIKKNV